MMEYITWDNLLNIVGDFLASKQRRLSNKCFVYHPQMSTLTQWHHSYLDGYHTFRYALLKSTLVSQ